MTEIRGNTARLRKYLVRQVGALLNRKTGAWLVPDHLAGEVEKWLRGETGPEKTHVTHDNAPIERTVWALFKRSLLYNDTLVGLFGTMEAVDAQIGRLDRDRIGWGDRISSPYYARSIGVVGRSTEKSEKALDSVVRVP